MHEPHSAVLRQVTDVTGLVRTGAVVLAVFAVCVGIWAGAVPIAGAVIAPGRVVSDGNVQVLRHEAGGIIGRIRVAEGDRVEPGDTLLVLNPARERAALGQIETRLAALDVKIARLLAERDATPFPAPATGGARTGEIAALAADQLREHLDWIGRRDAELSTLEAEAAALERTRAGVQGEIAALRRQAASVAGDVRLRRQALQDGFGRKARLHELEREQARLEGAQAQKQAQLAALHEDRGRLEARLAATRAGFAQQASAELSRARAERLEIAERLDAARQAVERVEIRAPAAGVVNRLHVNTPGSAVEPYAPLAEIVPDGAPLLVEARLAPTDIDEVHVGQEAEIVLSAFSRDETDPLPAEVAFVSVDSHLEERTGARYYTARLKVRPPAGRALPPIVPGMPVESYFRTGQHTLLQYLAEPLTASFARAFR